MSVGTFFSEIATHVQATIMSRQSSGTLGNYTNSNLSAWIAVTAYKSPGLTITSNQLSYDYGSSTSNEPVGVKVGGGAVLASDGGQGNRPRPIVTSMEIDEQNSNDGGQNFSRQASMTIRCFSLGQMEVVASHFLEPGYTCLLQWGWNDSPLGILGGANGPSGTEAAEMAEFSNVNARRAKAGGKCDVFLGFITGGDISFKEDFWDINVKLRGFLELPAFLMAADNQKKQSNADTTEEPQEYSGNQINGSTNIDTRRWMQGFNLLPSNKRTTRVKSILNDLPNIYCRDKGGWINVDESVRINVNASTKTTSILPRWLGGGTSFTATFGTIDAELEEDTELIGEHKYIRLATLFEILNYHDVLGYKLVNGAKIPTTISYKFAICGAFPKIFSTDATKLFIPNQKAPKPDFEAVAAGLTSTGVLGDWPCGVENASGVIIEFPNKAAYSGPPVDSRGYAIPNTDSISIAQGYWGYVGDLYVNLAFAKSVFETKGLSKKDAVYQLLNGLSSAAGSIWDFQLQELPMASGGDVAEIRIVDANLVYKVTKPPKNFVLSGKNSVFLEADLKIDMTQELANKIIGERLGAKFNSSMPPVKGDFFNPKPDLVLTALETNSNAAVDPLTGAGTPPTGDEAKKQAKADFLKFIKKCTLAPRVEIDTSTPLGKNVIDNCYLCAYDDQALFEALKNGKDNYVVTQQAQSVLLDTHITVTIHGVAGVKRGDKLNIDGLPSNYLTGGFFQITGVKQILQDDYWTTELTGTFRVSHG